MLRHWQKSRRIILNALEKMHPLLLKVFCVWRVAKTLNIFCRFLSDFVLCNLVVTWKNLNILRCNVNCKYGFLFSLFLALGIFSFLFIFFTLQYNQQPSVLGWFSLLADYLYTVVQVQCSVYVEFDRQPFQNFFWFEKRPSGNGICSSASFSCYTIESFRRWNLLFLSFSISIKSSRLTSEWGNQNKKYMKIFSFTNFETISKLFEKVSSIDQCEICIELWRWQIDSLIWKH